MQLETISWFLILFMLCLDLVIVVGIYPMQSYLFTKHVHYVLFPWTQ